MVNKANFLNRRDFLLGSTFSIVNVSKVLSENTAKKAHIVLLGGGWGGLSAAKTIRTLNKECKITIIEKNKKFMSCPISNWVIGQIKEMNDVSFDYNNFIKNNSINMIFDRVNVIDIDKKTIKTNNFSFLYDKLVLSPGIQLDYSNIEGLDNIKNKSIYTAWKAGEETKNLAKEIRKLQKMII